MCQGKGKTESGWFGLTANSPTTWIPASMKTTDDQNRISVKAIEKTVRKAPQEDSASISVQHGIGFGVGSNTPQCTINFNQKLVTQVCSPVSIPGISLLDVGCCCRPYEECHDPLFSRRLSTSSQGMPVGPSSSIESSRLSSSCFCAGVRGMSSGLWARLSQRRSRRRSRCSGESSSTLKASSSIRLIILSHIHHMGPQDCLPESV